MIVVTHLLGTGHLARALTLARAYLAAGDDVCVVSGGMPAPHFATDGMRFVQLPPVRSNGVDFATLLDENGQTAGQGFLAERQNQLLKTFAEVAPDILITELFPFGRRILKEEFQTLLDAAKSSAKPPLVCASIRDILAPPSKPKKALFAEEMIAQFYDAVLVHSVQALTPLELSWPVSETLTGYLRYTGFVAPPAAGLHPDMAGQGEIIISAGGGDVGGPIYEAALATATALDAPFRVLVGGAAPDARIAELAARAPSNVTVQSVRKDFRQMLYHAKASVSLCGYNTALDILQAATPAVFIPFDEGSEVEQGLRADALSKRDGIATLRRAALTGETLLAALREVIAAPRRTPDSGGFNGAATTVEITHQMRDAS
ncbi:Glycosyltransferase family 28 C-terminal domain [Sulfitobacter donghicola DSW-25 = KCTC 12864 = JCM 14565]|nr:Glycosyltransferase family 28 C-terminal domain [Sulfitobacter donghicola DSW-25 = KCTC 12864 = JCM 14565]